MTEVGWISNGGGRLHLVLGDYLRHASFLLYSETALGRRCAFVHLTGLQNHQITATWPGTKRRCGPRAELRWCRKHRSVARLHSVGEAVIRTDTRGRISDIAIVEAA